MNILVCGGAGYIGSHTVRQLEKAGFGVAVLDNLVKGHKGAIGNAELIQADINSKADLDAAFSNNKIDAVMHFAAYSLVGESVVKPGIYYRNNVCGTLNLLEAMVKYNVPYIVFSSTAAVYGEPEEVPIPEQHQTVPTNPYGATKLAVEGMLKWFDEAYGIKYVSLRYFNAAGADAAGDIGEDHSPESHLIPLVLKAALGIMPEIKVFGNDYSTPDGTCIRDYIHVTDLADAHVKAVEYLQKGGKSEVFNLGNGQGYSVLEVLNTAEEVVGHPIPHSFAPRRPGDPAVLVASAEKAKRMLSLEPQYGDLKTIVSTAWNWHKNNPKGFGEGK